jgi:hypothetical protein
MNMTTRIAGLLGPTLMAIVASEFPLVQPRLYAEQIPPVVYLSGVLMFVAGLAIVRWHNVWRRDWAVLVTLCGWSLLALGLVRMFAASLYRRASADASAAFFMAIEVFLFAIGLFLTVKAYARGAG